MKLFLILSIVIITTCILYFNSDFHRMRKSKARLAEIERLRKKLNRYRMDLDLVSQPAHAVLIGTLSMAASELDSAEKALYRGEYSTSNYHLANGGRGLKNIRKGLAAGRAARLLDSQIKN